MRSDTSSQESSALKNDGFTITFAPSPSPHKIKDDTLS